MALLERLEQPLLALKTKGGHKPRNALSLEAGKDKETGLLEPPKKNAALLTLILAQ